MLSLLNNCSKKKREERSKVDVSQVLWERAHVSMIFIIFECVPPYLIWQRGLSVQERITTPHYLENSAAVDSNQGGGRSSLHPPCDPFFYAPCNPSFHPLVVFMRWKERCGAGASNESR
jgi:hypothetical protein